MTPARRLFVLLSACENLTDRESGALRRGDIDHAVALERRKRRLGETLAEVRKNAELSSADADAYIGRVRCLRDRESENLAFLREEMARTRVTLSHLNQAAHRTRKVRRGYAGNPGTSNKAAELVLGRA